MKLQKHVKRFLAFLTAVALLPMIPLTFANAEEVQTVEQEKSYRIWFDEAAPWTIEGFERWSLPLGNGYMGINVFGGVETELLPVTENSLFNPYKTAQGTDADGDGVYVNDFGDERIDAASGGLNLFAKTYIDFAGHTTEGASNYKRELSLNNSVAKVSYDLDGVTYTREYFSTYPDKVTVMRLSASEAGKLSFVLRPEIPYCYDPEVDANKYSYLVTPGDGWTKTGKVTAEGDTITLKGTMDYFGTDFEGLYKVIPTGGSMVAANDANGKNGTITVTDADSVLVILAVGTNYDYEYVNFNNTKGMLNNAPDPHEKVQGYLDAAAQKSYDELLAAHTADYKEFFDRAKLDLGGVFDSTMTTDQLIANYRNGTYDPYLEEMAFQFGRYLLIASSREGCLPSNLQGIWNFSDSAAWSGGYWHNINVQMNYWPAFNTGLAELFQSYVDYNEAMRASAQTKADAYLKAIASPTIAAAGTGENGYTIGTGCTPYLCASASATGHSGPGTVAFTSLLFWDWYEYTQDKTILEEHTYPALEGASKFLSKTLKEYDDGTWLVYNSMSPENGINNVYIHSVGTAFDQEMVYANHLATKLAAEELGYTETDAPILATIEDQIDKLDPVKIGYSGQVKEYREEDYYGEFGEKYHRHISQLVGVYPASMINGDTDAWLDAAGVSLINRDSTARGETNIGWGLAHRLLCWARIQDAEQSYHYVQSMLKKHMGNNLFSHYNSTNKNNDPFQIEANFGYTAAVAEMLVQSHAGYIEFLPALPSAWEDGSFEGLTTRGNFAVDATWENGVATGFAIESRSGVECAVKYPNIAGAVVTDSKGNTVSFTAEGKDLIRFATTVGETYTITRIPSHTPNLAAPTALTLADSGSKMDLSWTASAGAVSYNVYRALNDAPSYELVKEGVTGTSYTYAYTDIQGSDRVTMRVVAVAADGTESSSALAYSLPLTALEKVTGYMFRDNMLQLEYVPLENASEYRVYENGILVSTSNYGIAAVKNADPTATYSVSVVVDGRESAATVATVYQASQQDNILLNKPLTLEGRNYWISGYEGTYGVDGDTTIPAKWDDPGRWSVSKGHSPYYVTADLQGIYKLGTMTFYEWNNASDPGSCSPNTTVEVLTPEGEWVTVKSGFSLTKNSSTTVELGGVQATKVRWTFNNDTYDSTHALYTATASIAEITCTGEKLEVVNKIELLEAVQAYTGQSVTSSGFAGVQVAYILAEPEAVELLTDPDATQLAVDKAARNLTKAATGPNIFKNQNVSVNLNHIGSYSADMMLDSTITEPSRWAVSEGSNAGTTEDHAVVTITLDGLYHLGGVFVQEYLNANQQSNGGSVTIEVSTDGSTWTTVLSGASLREYRDSIPLATSSNTAFVFENTVLAKQVRLTFDDSIGAANKAITIFEIQGYGDKVDESKLYLSSNSLTLASGKTYTLTASAENVRWTSSDSNVVSVDSTGKLTAHNCGKAAVTATDANGATATCAITVVTDTTELKAAIVAAEAAMAGVVANDRQADKVYEGTKFVPSDMMASMEDMLADAKDLAENPTDAATVDSQTAALNAVTETFLSKLQTGTMSLTNHSHCVCTGALDHACTAITWTAWGDDEGELTSLPTTTGNYFLVADIEINKEFNIGNDQPTVVVNLCLNGFNIVGTHTNGRVYNVYSKLNICDCSEESKWGKISGSDTSFATIQLRDIRSNKGEMNLYSGIITAEEGTVCADGGLIRLGNSNTNGTTFNMYGGKLTGGNSANGGAVNILSKSTFNMYGGEISGNTSTNGGAFYNKGTLNISGGTVIGTKTTYGGCIYSESGTVNITGGTFSGGSGVGGMVYIAAGTLKITGGTMSNCSSNTGRGGLVCVVTGALEMSNVHISGITAQYGAVLDIRKGATATISGCTFTDCSSTDSAGTFFVDGATVNIDNCIFDGNTSGTNGGNLYLQGGGKLTVTNSTVINGTAAKGSDIYVSSGTATLENVTVGTANGDTDLWLQGGTLTLGKGMTFTGSVTDLYKNGGTLKLAADFSANRAITADGQSTVTTLCAATAQQGAMFIGAGSRSITYDGTNVVFTDSTVLLCGDTTTAYGSVWAAMKAMTEGQYVKLSADTAENITVSDTLYLDLNGKTLTGNITGEGTLYGMDNATDSYTTENIGRIEGTVSCQVAGNFKTDVTGAVRRYMALADDNGYTFHRFYLGITHMSLKPAANGVGYKAVFYGDQQVLEQVTGYGYTLWVGENGQKLSAGKEEAFVSGKTVTLRLQNFDVENYGEEKVYGQVYLKLADGTTVESSDYSYTLRVLVENIAADISGYTATQLQALQKMLADHADATAHWNIDSIRNYQ